MRVRALLENPSLMLKPDMFIEALITRSATEAELLILPMQALIRTGEQNRVVLALGDGKFKSIEVQVGRVFAEGIEIVEGLLNGNEVVVSGQFLLDSESSISSDFVRMEQAENMAKSIAKKEILEDDTLGVSAWTHATVNEVLIEDAMLNLTHGELLEFNMMGMTMNFMVDESIDLSMLEEGMTIHVEIVKSPSGMYKVITIHHSDNVYGNGSDE